jgi:hypothetical protein
MRRALSACIALMACVALVVAAEAGAAGKLPIPVAAERAKAFAERTCKHDDNCARSGVSNCKRQKRRVVLCRIFLHRRTAAQGHYRCTRLVRLIPTRNKPHPKHAKVSGVGRWSC